MFQHAKLYSIDEVSEALKKAGYVVSDVKGTLNSDPMNQEVDGNLVEPNKMSGVLIVKAE